MDVLPSNNDNNELPQNYMEAKEKLLSDVKNARFLFQARKVFIEFSTKMTMTPDLWQKWIVSERAPAYISRHYEYMRMNKIRCLASSHFCFEPHVLANYYIPLKFNRSVSWLRKRFYCALWTNITFPLSFETFERTLSFPHPNLKSCFHECQMFSDEPISPELIKTYESNLALYEEIKNVNIKEYSYNLEDVEFAIENLEWELAKQPTSKKLWEFFLQFLKDKNQTKTLLNAYSRYCRLFIDDEIKRKEYLSFIETVNTCEIDTTKWWIDLIEIERIFGSVVEARKLLKNVINKSNNKILLNYSKWFEQNFLWKEKEYNFLANLYSTIKTKIFGSNLPKKFELEKPKKIELWLEHHKNVSMKKLGKLSKPTCQNFHFPFFIMEYIYNFGSIKTKYNLQKCCKQIFYSKKQIFCHKLEVYHFRKQYFKPKYVGQSLHICNKDLKAIKKLHVTNLLKINSQYYPDLCSDILRKIDCSNVQYLFIYEQKLTVREMKLLSCKKLKCINFIYLNIINCQNESLPVEDILELFPYPTDIRFVHRTFTENTAQKMAILRNVNKFERFLLNFLPQSFDLEAFISFLKENGSTNAYCAWCMAEDVSIGYKRFFTDSVKRSLPLMAIQEDCSA